jgi:hypothetical protein
MGSIAVEKSGSQSTYQKRKSGTHSENPVTVGSAHALSQRGMAEQNNTTNPEAPTEIYNTVRSQIEHLDNNLSQRVIWLVIAQSFFFSGYAILLTARSPEPVNHPVQDLMLVVLPVASLLIVLLTYMDVIIALICMRRLSKVYEDAPRNGETDKVYPPVFGFRNTRPLQYSASVVMPLIFIATWITLLVTQVDAKKNPPPPPQQQGQQGQGQGQQAQAVPQPAASNPQGQRGGSQPPMQ